MKPKPSFIAGLGILVLSACVQEPDNTRVDAVRGKQLFQNQCAACHGTQGEGAGIASLGLGAPPPSLQHLKRDNDGVFPTEYVLSVIDGLERHDHATAAMPEFGAGDMGPLIHIEKEGLVTPVPADLLALATYLESIQL